MASEQKNLTSITELGEFGLINRITQGIKLKQAGTKKGIGDDAAVLDFGEKMTVVTNDLLVEGIHFNLAYAPLMHVGYKSVVVNLSDVYAMNAQPTQILVSIAVSNRFTVEAIEELYKGINFACEAYGVDLVGGDTTSSQKGLTISITALGVADKAKLAYRNGAQPNDLLCVSGNLGAAYMGLQLLEREKKIFEIHPSVQPELDKWDYIVERQLKPEARKDIVAGLAELGIVPTSMIDISDGLSSEVLHLCQQSDKGCQLYEDKIPIDAQTIAMAEEFNLDPTVCALNGGEDYELLFTIKAEEYAKIKTLDTVSVIGHITEADIGSFLVTRDGSRVPLVAQGWDGMQQNADLN